MVLGRFLVHNAAGEAVRRATVRRMRMLLPQSASDSQPFDSHRRAVTVSARVLEG